MATPTHRQSHPRATVRRVGLARALSKLGCCSRSRAFAMIRAGCVRLNGAVQFAPEAPVRLGREVIEVDGQPARPAGKIYFMMNKPRGVVTTASDEKSRCTVYAHLPADLPWLAPVGRLDMASEGLLLLTNDSEWAARITAPETRLEKTYHVQINKLISPSDLERIVLGIRVNSGEMLRAKRASLLRLGQRNCWLEIVLDEGKNRHIRRIIESLSLEVLRLVRVSIGPLPLGVLSKGACRALTCAEKAMLDRATHARKH